MSRESRIALIVFLLTVIAFGLRAWRIDAVPPGLRTDELSNVFVVSQRILEGRLMFFYPEASGQEGLHHALVTGAIWLFGNHIWSIRSVSVLFGTLSVPLTYLVGRRLFGPRVGLLAAGAMTFSFWSLMYSRTGIRQISTVVFLLPAVYFTLRGLRLGAELDAAARRRPHSAVPWLLAALFAGIGLHTYFAAWVTPVLVFAVVAVGLLLERQRARWWPHWHGLLLFGLVVAVLAAPLLADMAKLTTEDEGNRIDVVAGPLYAALAGDFGPVLQQTVETFSMVHAHGDSEWLYNIPLRPVFAPVLALLFWAGVAVAVWRSVRAPTPDERLAAGLLLLWWVLGISPAFISVPSSSFGHTIAALPAVYLLLALPVDALARRFAAQQAAIWALAAVLVIGLVAWRDLPAYFVDWPAYSFVRFLYHDPMRQAGNYLHAQPALTDVALSGLLDGRWEQTALRASVPKRVRARWYNGQRAIMLQLAGRPAVNFGGYPDPDNELFLELYEPESLAVMGGYIVRRVSSTALAPADEPRACFANGLCLLAAEQNGANLDLTWRVERPLDLPPLLLNSYPPVPGSYEGQRLRAFVHLRDGSDTILTGDDGLWIDPYTLQAGDSFRQRHILPPPPDSAPASIAIGLYDPLTGARILAADGRELIVQTWRDQ